MSVEWVRNLQNSGAQRIQARSEDICNYLYRDDYIREIFIQVLFFYALCNTAWILLSCLPEHSL